MPDRPAVIVIARHGNRLDAADKSWHLTSPTPYDPPLTYGGWQQSRALGLRIAGLLEARGQSTDSTTKGQPLQKSKRKKQKIYIHSSPFQRCIQTSIGISAGLAQYQIPRDANNSANPNSNSDLLRSNSRTRSPAPGFSSSSPRLHAVGESRHMREQFRRNAQESDKVRRATLRVDAFLGEWLSPDYFDMITPPPPSSMMLAGSKAELLRKADEIDKYSLSPNPATMRGSAGNLWGSDGASSSQNTGAAPTPEGQTELKSLSQALPTRRDRSWSSTAGSQSGRRSSPFGRMPSTSSPLAQQEYVQHYTPPAPSYAISPVESIPKGYVAHARDACIEIDYQWDSMREPLFWGDGGDFGEEWSAMHKRFRKGLTGLVDFYDRGGAKTVLKRDDNEAVPEIALDDTEEDDDTEVVIVLVTHGAGCNALLGGLTEQPVLLDFGMASLTMAVSKQHKLDAGRLSLSPKSETTRSDIEKALRNHSDSGLSQVYDIKIVASTEHLRAGTDPSRPPVGAAPSPVLPASKTVPDSRRRSTLATHAAAGAPIETTWASNFVEPGKASLNAALGSMRRPSVATVQTAHSVARTGSVGSVSSSTGLWAPQTPPLREADRETSISSTSAPKKDSISEAETLDLAREAEPPSPRPGTSESNKLGITYSNSGKAPEATKVHVVEGQGEDAVSELPGAGSSGLGRTLSQRGLWGSVAGGPQVAKDKGPKRRWTAQQE